MFLRKSVLVFVALFIAFGVVTQNVVFAEKESTLLDRKKQQKKPTQPQAQPVEGGACACLKPAIDAIQKAYSSLEEDEWPKAIGECKNTIATINNLAQSCTCEEINAYKSTADAFLKYAEGGNHLDGADEPDCPYALKTYSASISGLQGAKDKILDKNVKTSVKNILEYAQEEELFVKDECLDQKKP